MSLANFLIDLQKQHTEQERQKRIANILWRIQMQQDEIQRELALVLENFSYPKLKQVKSIADLRQDGFRITKDNRIIYFFTVDKTDWEKIPAVICKDIRDNMNKDIITYTKELAKYITAYEAMCMYPVLYYGLCIILIEDHQTAVRLAVITNMPL